MASAACIKSAGVPVEFIVATIFCAMMALLPMPVTTNRPRLLKIRLTASAKLLSIIFLRLATVADSCSITSTAMAVISSFVFILSDYCDAER